MKTIQLVSDLDEDKDRNFITALARGLDVLRCFQPNETILTNTDFAKRTGLPKPTISRLIYTLCKLEYLTLDESTGGYRLGVGVLSLGFGVLSGMSIAERAQSELRSLCDGPNSYITCALAERHLTDALYVAVARSREAVALYVSVGSRLPIFYSAIGRAILTALPEEEREEVFKIGMTIDPDNVAKQKSSYTEAIAEFEAHGYCTSYGDWRGDVNAIAVPVQTLDGRVFGLNAGGPSFHIKKKQLETVYGPLLIKAAKSLSMRPE